MRSPTNAELKKLTRAGKPAAPYRSPEERKIRKEIRALIKKHMVGTRDAEGALTTDLYHLVQDECCRVRMGARIEFK